MNNLKYIIIAFLSILIQQSTLATENKLRLNINNLKPISESEVMELPLIENLKPDSLKAIVEDEVELPVDDISFSCEEVCQYKRGKIRLPLQGLIEIRADELMQ